MRWLGNRKVRLIIVDKLDASTVSVHAHLHFYCMAAAADAFVCPISPFNAVSSSLKACAWI